MFKRGKHHGSQKLEEFPEDEVEMNPKAEQEKDEERVKGKESPADPGGLERLEAKLPLMFRIRGTVINGIWWQILLVVIWSAAVVGVYMNVEEVRFEFKPILIQLMGVVCGLLLAFRSNSAYDRYWEGRKYWSTMTLGIRNLTRLIWINVKEENTRDIIEKKSAINLLIAFAIATKHYLREEYDFDFEDLLNITPHIDWLQTPSSNLPIHIQDKEKAKSTEAIGAAKISLETVVTVIPDSDPPPPPLLTPKITKKKKKESSKTPPTESPPSSFKRDESPVKHYRFKAHDIATPTNIPLELSYYIGSYINSVRLREKCDSGTVGGMSASLGALVECLTGFERILRTPIPLAYSVHLHQSIWIYILALPFQLVHTNGYWTILVVGITAFFLLGILAIGWEIENPFGYDDNDLPLDDFCKVLRREIEVIVSHKAMVPDDWVFKKRNKPFAPECNIDAIELAERPVEDILNILADRGIKISESNVLERPVVHVIPKRVPRSIKKRHASASSTKSADGNADLHKRTLH